MSDPRRNRKADRRGGRGEQPRRPRPDEEEIIQDPPPENTEEADEGTPPGEGEGPSEKDEILDRYQRLAAEFDNYRKRQARDFNRLIDQGRRNLVKELITVLDNFDRARATAQGEHSDKEIVDGIMQTSEQLKSILKKEGLEEVATEPGDPFDPNVHEAMFAEDIEDGDVDIILEVYQKAYRYGQDLIRPAMVKVGRVSGKNGG